MQIIDPLETWLLAEIRRRAPRSLSPEELARAAIADNPSWSGDATATGLGASAIREDWRRLLPRLRQVAANLARQGELVFLRKGKAIDPVALKGVFRIKYNGINKKTDSIP